MILLKALGLVRPDVRRENVENCIENLESVQQELDDMAEAMLRSRVRLTGQEWAELIPEERRAMIRAGNALHAEFVEDVVRSMWDHDYLARLTSSYDGGELARTIEKGRALDALSSKMDDIRKDFGRNRYVIP